MVINVPAKGSPSIILSGALITLTPFWRAPAASVVRKVIMNKII
jgi:hypothetical protein